MTTLTSEQKHLVELAGDKPVRFEDPETHQIYVVIKEEIYRQLQDVAELDQSDPSLFEFEDFRPSR
jgi:hypothetical protein